MAWWEWESGATPPQDVPLAPGPVFKPDRPTKIMAIGDSITRGQGAEAQGGWRKPLWDALRADGRTITPVGPFTAVAPPGYMAEGGWRIDDQTGVGARNLTGGNAVDAARQYKPDVLLVGLGTNDVAQGISGAQLTDYVASYRLLLDSLYAFVPAAHVFICRIVLLENQWPGTRTFNDRVQSMTEAYVAKGRPYHLVVGMEDMPAGSWADGLHPNKQGYDYLADVWKTAIDAAAVVQGASGYARDYAGGN